MSSDARRPLTEEERARVHAARRSGGMCAACGRAFVAGEAIWIESLAVHGEHGGTTHWQVPVGAECVAPETVRATCTTQPEPCAGCGRGVYYQATRRRRGRVLCSRRCKVANVTRQVRLDHPTADSPAPYDVQESGDAPPWER